MFYDEQEALAYIRRQLPADIPAYDDDDILNVIDIVWDYYEQNGMLEIDPDDADDDLSETPDELLEALTEYGRRMLARDKVSSVDPAHLPAIIAAELAYEQSIML